MLTKDISKLFFYRMLRVRVRVRDEKPVISRLMELKKTVEYICSTKCRGKEFFMNIF